MQFLCSGLAVQETCNTSVRVRICGQDVISGLFLEKCILHAKFSQSFCKQDGLLIFNLSCNSFIYKSVFSQFILL